LIGYTLGKLVVEKRVFMEDYSHVIMIKSLYNNNYNSIARTAIITIFGEELLGL
jgi:hypothetical protein